MGCSSYRGRLLIVEQSLSSLCDVLGGAVLICTAWITAVSAMAVGNPLYGAESCLEPRLQ